MTGTYDDITGIILVGGKSRRMGRDKAFLDFHGTPLFENVLDLFRDTFRQVALVGDRAERFAAYPVPVFPDIYPGSALGGLYTGLVHASTGYIAVASCDMPFPSGDVLRHLCSLRTGYDVVVPATSHGYEPLFAVYAKSCLPTIRKFLDDGNYCAFGYYPQLKVREVTEAEIASFATPHHCFINLNTPEQAEDAEKSLETSSD